MSDDERSRTVTWRDPAVAAGAVGTVPGIEFLRAIGRGEIPAPPMMRTLGIEAVGFEEGIARFAATPAEYHYNPLGTVHGGLAAAICDSALGCAIQTLLPAGTGYTTLELKINYVRPLTAASGRVIAEGRVVHRGSRTATADARLTDAEGRLYAHASATCLLFVPPQRDAQPEPLFAEQSSPS